MAAQGPAWAAAIVVGRLLRGITLQLRRDKVKIKPPGRADRPARYSREWRGRNAGAFP